MYVRCRIHCDPGVPAAPCLQHMDLWRGVRAQVAASHDAAAASAQHLERDAEQRIRNLARVGRVTDYLVSCKMYKWQPVRPRVHTFTHSIPYSPPSPPLPLAYHCIVISLFRGPGFSDVLPEAHGGEDSGKAHEQQGQRHQC